MHFEELGIQALVVIVYLVLLIVFYMTAHNDQRLSHEEHKESSEQGQHQEDDTCVEDHFFEMQVEEIDLMSEPMYERIIIRFYGGNILRGVPRYLLDALRDFIDHKSRDLR